MTHVDAYAPPRHAELDFTRQGVTLVPRPLAVQTRKIVNRFQG